jgi:hypothetical protein
MDENFAERPDYIHRLIRGPLVASKAMAEDLASVAIKHEYSADEVVNLGPLTIADRGETWEVRAPGVSLGRMSGICRIIIRKYDGAFLDITVLLPP